MNITILTLTQSNRICGFLFTSHEIGSLQQFKEELLNGERSIVYSPKDSALLIMTNERSVLIPFAKKHRPLILGFLHEEPEWFEGKTGEETSFAFTTHEYQTEVTAEILFSSKIEIMLEEQIAA